MPIHFRGRFLVFSVTTSLVVACFFLPSLSHAVTVGPAKLELSVNPGESVSGTVFVENETAQTQTLSPSIQRFTEDNGDKVFLPNSELASWIQLPSSITLHSGEQRDVPFILNAPADAAPGGHFAVIWWSGSSANGTGSSVGIVTRAGILVYLRVSGNIVEKGHIGFFNTASFFHWGLPVTFSFDFTNDGNVALSPQGTIRITNLFGGLKAVVPVNPFGGSVLPASNKTFDVAWSGQGFFFGLYRATLDLSYGESKTAVSRSYWFVMLSPAGIAVFVLVIVLLFILPPFIRRYNRWIIARAKQ